MSPAAQRLILDGRRALAEIRLILERYPVTPAPPLRLVMPLTTCAAMTHGK